MEFLASYGLLAVAVLISFILTAAATPNPAKIPLRAFLPWTAVGLALFLVFWVPVGVLTCRLLFALLPRSWLSTPAAWSISLLVGLLLPQVGKLKDRFLTPGIARLVRPLTAVLQFIDEYTRLFLSTVINRKERKVSLEFFGSETANRRRALDRLYEDLNIEIARDLAQSGASPEVVFGVFKVRQQTIKFKYLMRYFGYTDCLKQLRFVAASPGVVFPSWPSDQGDRRTGAGEEDLYWLSVNATELVGW